jgi:hypothetical protein
VDAILVAARYFIGRTYHNACPDAFRKAGRRKIVRIRRIYELLLPIGITERIRCLTSSSIGAFFESEINPQATDLRTTLS